MKTTELPQRFQPLLISIKDACYTQASIQLNSLLKKLTTDMALIS